MMMMMSGSMLLIITASHIIIITDSASDCDRLQLRHITAISTRRRGREQQSELKGMHAGLREAS